MSTRFRADAPGRADQVVRARFPGVSRKRVAALFARGAVRVDGRVARKGDAVRPGADIEVLEAPRPSADFTPAPAPDMALEVLYCDDHLVAVNKPPGVPSHPLAPDEHTTLANALVARFAGCARASEHAREAGLAHRLDTGTSGAILAARDPDTWQALRRMFSRRQVEKRYLALVAGAGVEDGGSDQPLVRRGPRMAVASARDRDALPASTSWRVVERFGAYTLVECVTHTGRMHQVRVHLAAAAAPIVGDAQYRGAPAGTLPVAIQGHFLHAGVVALVHPGAGARLVIEAPLPADRQALLDALR